MKLLFDQNISFRVVRQLQTEFPMAQQVRLLGLENASDQTIWNYAKENGYCIITFDSDFSDIAGLMGHPPKIIWLRTGNLTTKNIANLLVKHKLLIKDFLEKSEYTEIACLEID